MPTSTPQKTVTVAVSPATNSKINWTQLASILAMAAAYFGLDVSAETLAAIIFGIASAGDVITMVWKTWFTKTVTPESIAKS